MVERRKDYVWKKLVADVKATETHCWVCGQIIDRSLRGRHPWAFSVDHVVPITYGGEQLARSNLRAAHLHCNVVRHAKIRAAFERAEHIHHTSREW